jgi:hypothetical protein
MSASDDKADFRLIEFGTHQRTLKKAEILVAMNGGCAAKVDGQTVF